MKKEKEKGVVWKGRLSSGRKAYIKQQSIGFGCAIYGKSWKCGYIEFGKKDLPSEEECNRFPVYGGITYIGDSHISSKSAIGFDTSHGRDSDWSINHVKAELEDLDQYIRYSRRSK